MLNRVTEPVGHGLTTLLLLALSLPASAEVLLSGTVRSRDEDLMEGVFVNARRAGGTITVSVLSDADGRWRFPEGRLRMVMTAGAPRLPSPPIPVPTAAGPVCAQG